MGKWQNFTLTAADRPGLTTGNDIACCSRMAGHLEVFYIAADGSIWSYFWYGTWQNFQLRPPGSAVMGGITAVSHRSQSMAVWWISPSGSVECAFWEDGSGWRYSQTAGPGSAAIHTKIVSLCRQSENIELLWMGKNGSVEGTTWGPNGWVRHQVAGENSAVIMFSGLTHVSRRAEAHEVWWISPRGSVEAAWRWGMDKWNRYQVAGDGSAAVEGATLRAHSRLSDTMNMWWVGPRGSVEGAYTIVDKLPWSRYQIAPDNSASKTGCIFSLHRMWLTEEIWWIANDGGIKGAFWYEGMGPWGQFQLAPPGTAKPYGSIHGHSRDIGVMDLFVERMDSKVESYWYEFRRKDFPASIPSGGLAALGGWTNVTLLDDGFIRWNGNGHNSGADDYDYALVGYCRPKAGVALEPIVHLHQGHVEGHIFGSSGRDDGWHEVTAVETLRTKYDDYANGTFELNTQYTSSIVNTFETLLNTGIKLAVGSMLGGAGVFILLGATAISLITTGNTSAGARVINGVLYMAGPANTLIAIAAEGLASIGSRSRTITEDEYNWANAQVFKGKLPPRDKIVITDTRGKDDRAFVFPMWDGKISVNLGGKPGRFEDPRANDDYRHTFVHELVHVWQIHHTPMQLVLLAKALANQMKGQTAYQYGPAGPSFKDGFNLEQQAQIVADWWYKGWTAQPRTEAVNDSYYRYVRDNIRTGLYF